MELYKLVLEEIDSSLNEAQKKIQKTSILIKQQYSTLFSSNHDNFCLDDILTNFFCNFNFLNLANIKYVR